MEKNWAEFLNKHYYVEVSIDISYDKEKFSLRPTKFDIETTVKDSLSGDVLLHFFTVFNNIKDEKYIKKTEEDFEI